MKLINFIIIFVFVYKYVESKKLHKKCLKHGVWCRKIDECCNGRCVGSTWEVEYGGTCP
jgi:hypothetical protein